MFSYVLCTFLWQPLLLQATLSRMNVNHLTFICVLCWWKILEQCNHRMVSRTFPDIYWAFPFHPPLYSHTSIFCAMPSRILAHRTINIYTIIMCTARRGGGKCYFEDKFVLQYFPIIHLPRIFHINIAATSLACPPRIENITISGVVHAATMLYRIYICKCAGDLQYSKTLVGAVHKHTHTHIGISNGIGPYFV